MEMIFGSGHLDRLHCPGALSGLTMAPDSAAPEIEKPQRDRQG